MRYCIPVMDLFSTNSLGGKKKKRTGKAFGDL